MLAIGLIFVRFMTGLKFYVHYFFLFKFNIGGIYYGLSSVTRSPPRAGIAEVSGFLSLSLDNINVSKNKSTSFFFALASKFSSNYFK